ncbi:hypothetical protein H0H87_008090, partial [Tephrocybe sp. NHM501043]
MAQPSKKSQNAKIRRPPGSKKFIPAPDSGFEYSSCGSDKSSGGEEEPEIDAETDDKGAPEAL